MNVDKTNACRSASKDDGAKGYSSSATIMTK